MSSESPRIRAHTRWTANLGKLIHISLFSPLPDDAL
jgi:hypothetical protein